MSKENLSGRTLAGYRLLERVGEGGTASVYRAEHPERGACAVKVLKERMRSDPTAVKRFLREAGYGSRVEHPGVVCTYDYGEEDNLYYLALEWAAGEPLSEFVHRSGRLAPALTVKLIGQLAGGLAVAHQEGIIHRDLKPENIVYDPETQTVKLLDFGIARDAQMDDAERLTRTGFFVGTLNYVAPEALSGELVSESADIYSLATIAYYLLTGIHPYPGRSPRELFQQLLTQDPIPLNEAVQGVRFTEILEAAIMAALARDPSARPATVEEFAQRLEGALEDGGHAAPAPGPPTDGGGGGLLGKMKSMFRKKVEN
jgi:serine/threonine-protein kinase